MIAVAEAAREYVVPCSCIAEPPATSVCPSITYSEAVLWVITLEPMVMTGATSWTTAENGIEVEVVMRAEAGTLTTGDAVGVSGLCPEIKVPESVVRAPMAPSDATALAMICTTDTDCVACAEGNLKIEVNPFCTSAVSVPEVTREYLFPATTIPEPPAESVWDAYTRPELGFKVIIEEPSVICGGSASECAGAGLWSVSRVATELASEYAVSPTVMAGPPGARVWEPMMYSVEGLGIIVVEPRVRIGAIAIGVSALLGRMI